MADQHYFDTTLLLSFDGDNGSTLIEDRSPQKNRVAVSGDAKLSTAFSKFGGSSMVFDGNGDYLTVDNFALDIGSGDFTVEGWARSTGASGVRVIIGRTTGGVSAASTQQYLIYWYGTKLECAVYNPSVPFFVATTANDVNDGQFHHFALVRKDTQYTFFVNGTVVNTLNSASMPTDGSQMKTYIGSSGPGAAFWCDGNVDDIRVTRNVCRYTQEFTPPAEANDSEMLPVSPILIAPQSVVSVDGPDAALRSIAPQPPVRDIYHAGIGKIAGTIKETGTPNSPVFRRVRLFRDKDGLMLRETWSDPVTGEYQFEYIDEAQTYTVVSYDHVGVYRAVVADRVTPEIMA
jgi:hypothetical protein